MLLLKAWISGASFSVIQYREAVTEEETMAARRLLLFWALYIAVLVQERYSLPEPDFRKVFLFFVFFKGIQINKEK